MLGGAGAQQRTDDVRRNRRDDAQRDCPDGLLAALVHGALGVTQVREDAPGKRQSFCPASVSVGSAREAVEERLAHLRLQLLDLLAQRRLGDAHALRCEREPALLGDGDKVAELVDFHRQRLSFA